MKVHDPRARRGRGERGVQAKRQCPGRPFDSELVDPLDGGKSASQAHQLIEARAALAHRLARRAHRIGRRDQIEEATDARVERHRGGRLRLQSPSVLRTAAGHLAVSSPWFENNATASRSMPKATHPVCAGSPPESRIPRRAEVVAMIVEAHARGRRRVLVERNQQLELQRLLSLADRHDLSDAAEERVVGDVDLSRGGRDRRRGRARAPSSCRGTR